MNVLPCSLCLQGASSKTSHKSLAVIGCSFADLRRSRWQHGENGTRRAAGRVDLGRLVYPRHHGRPSLRARGAGRLAALVPLPCCVSGSAPLSGLDLARSGNLRSASSRCCAGPPSALPSRCMSPTRAEDGPGQGRGGARAWAAAACSVLMTTGAGRYWNHHIERKNDFCV